MDPPELPLKPLLEPPLEPLEPLETLEPLEPPPEPPELETELLEPPFPKRQGSLGEVIRVGSLQGSEKVPMLLAKVPGEENHGQWGPRGLASSSPFRPISITCHCDFSGEEPGESLGQKRKEEAVI